MPVSSGRWLAIIPLVILLVIWTDPWTGLFRGSPHIAPGTPFPQLVFSGQSYFVDLPILCLSDPAAGNLFSGSANFLHGSAASIAIKWLPSIGCHDPLVDHTGHHAPMVPYQLQDIAHPLSFAVSNMIVSWALFRYRLV